MCVTGNSTLDIILGVAIIAATAGAAAPGVAAVEAGTIAAGTAGTFGAFLTGGSLVAGSAGAAALGAGVISGGLALASTLLTPKAPDFSEQQSPQVQQFNSQNIATTGSGGRQAAGSLAEAIKRTKDRKLTQRDVGDLSIDTGSFAPTGLQFA